jgi:hypothetical protein
MGNTKSTSQQYSDAYAAKRYEAIVDQNSGDIKTLKDTVNGNLIAVEGLITGVNGELTAYISKTNAELVAIKSNITSELTNAATLTDSKLATLKTDLQKDYNLQIAGVKSELDATKQSLTNLVTSFNTYADATNLRLDTVEGTLKTYTAIVDTHTGEIAALQESLEGKIVQAGATASGALQTYIDSNTKELVALESKLTGQITAAKNLNETEFDKIKADLASQGITLDGKINDVKSSLDQYKVASKAEIDAMKADTADYKVVTDNALTTIRTTLANFQTAYNTFTTDTLKNNYTFNRFFVGNQWYLQPQVFNGQDNLCIGKGNKTLMCIDTNGDFNYDTNGQPAVFA